MQREPSNSPILSAHTSSPFTHRSNIDNKADLQVILFRTNGWVLGLLPAVVHLENKGEKRK